MSLNHAKDERRRSSVWRIRSLQYQIKNRIDHLSALTNSENMIAMDENLLPSLEFKNTCSYCNRMLPSSDFNNPNESMNSVSSHHISYGELNPEYLKTTSSDYSAPVSNNPLSTISDGTFVSSLKEVAENDSSLSSEHVKFDIPSDSQSNSESTFSESQNRVRANTPSKLNYSRKVSKSPARVPTISVSQNYPATRERSQNSGSSNNYSKSSFTSRRENLLARRQSTANKICRQCLTSGSICVEAQWPYDQRLDEFLNSNANRKKHPLTTTFFNLLGKHKEIVIEEDERELLVQFMHRIEKSYQDVPYHSKLHAVDVLTGAEVLMNQAEEGNNTCFTPFERFTLLIAAACHDVGHPSVNSHYVFSSSDSVDGKTHLQELKDFGETGLLEKAHSTISLNYMREIGLTKYTNDDEFVDLFNFLILATDMSQHNLKVEKLNEILEKAKSDTGSSGAGSGSSNANANANYFQDKSTRREILAIILHLADLSNPAKNFEDSEEWAGKVCNEFFQQGDIENFKTGKITNKIFDRKATSIEDSQIGFINWVVLPLVNSWCELLKKCRHSQSIKDMLLKNRDIYVERQAEKMRIRRSEGAE